MKPIILPSALFVILFACSGPPTDSSSKEESRAVSQESLKSKNFAVVWEWATSDRALIEKEMPNISQELNNLWMDGVVENAYFDPEASSEPLGKYPNISFFIKAKDRSEAHKILDELRIVKLGMAEYETHPVGTLWLKRSKDRDQAMQTQRAFVVVWTTKKNLGSVPEGDKILQAQNDTILSNWKKGIIENVYFDMEGPDASNEDTDFVFFLNVSTMQEARSFCDALPFSQNGIAGYQAYQSGLFWLGLYEEE